MSKIMNQQKLSFFEPYYNIWIDCIQHFCWPEFDRIYRCCKTMFVCDVRVSLCEFHLNEINSFLARARAHPNSELMSESYTKYCFKREKFRSSIMERRMVRQMLRWRHAKQLYTCVAVLFFLLFSHFQTSDDRVSFVKL